MANETDTPVNCTTHSFIRDSKMSPVVVNEGTSTRKIYPLFRLNQNPGFRYALIGMDKGAGSLEETEDAPEIPDDIRKPSGLVHPAYNYNSWVWRNPNGIFNDAHIDIAPRLSRRQNLVLEEVINIMNGDDAEAVRSFIFNDEYQSLFFGVRATISSPTISPQHDFIGLITKGSKIAGFQRFGSITNPEFLPNIFPSNEWQHPAGFHSYRYLPAGMSPTEQTNIQIKLGQFDFTPNRRKKSYYENSQLIGDILKTGDRFSLSLTAGMSMAGSNYLQVAEKVGALLANRAITESGLRSVINATLEVKLEAVG